MNKIFMEPYKIKMVEALHLSTKSQRQKWLQAAHYNQMNLRSKQIFVDLLTDSGAVAMSAKQWAGMMMADEIYAGSESYYKLKKVVEDLFGLPYFLPAHQGRAAENVLFSVMLKKGDIVPGNAHFFTTIRHIVVRDAKPLDLTAENENSIFKGNINLVKLEERFKRTPKEKIPLVVLTITCNSVGALPVSMANIKSTAKLCKKHKTPLFFDAARFAENAYFIKKHEKGFSGRSIKNIVKEMFSYVAGFMMSAKKDGLVNMGGLIGLRDKKLFDAASVFTIQNEGFITYGGLAGRDLAALAQGLTEVVEFNYLQARIEQVAYLGEQLKKAGVPVLHPFGGHAIFLDAGKFYPHISRNEYRSQILNNAIYLEGGIRGVGIDTLVFDRNPKTKKEIHPKQDLVRLCIPRRTYTNNHMDYIAEIIIKIYKDRNKIKHGYKIVKEAPTLRSFSVMLAKIGFLDMDVTIHPFSKNL
jgi:tryptophanase